jgi:mRNA interferase RelE/StbE
MTYTVVVTEYAVRQLKKLPSSVVSKLKEAITDLAQNPRPHNSTKLTNVEAYRIRVGNYRIVYEINDNILIVTVVEVSDRKETYRKR